MTIMITELSLRGEPLGVTNRDRMTFGILSFASLISGALLYLFFRENTYLSRIISSFIDISKTQKAAAFLSCDLTMYYLPDYLWALSLCLGLCCVIYHPARTKASAIITIAAGVLWEIFQYTDIVFGTGDIHDIILYLAASFTAVTINNLILRRKT